MSRRRQVATATALGLNVAASLALLHVLGAVAWPSIVGLLGAMG